MFKIKIANIKVQANLISTDFFEKRFKEYAADFIGKADFEITTKIENKITLPQGKILKSNKQAVLVQIDDNTKCLAIPFTDSEFFSRTVKYTNDWSKVEITLQNRVYYEKLSFTDMEYMQMADAFCHRLTMLGGVCLHSSAISFDNIGIGFSENSGTGKSTQAGLWQDYFGDRVSRINDDRPALRLIDDKIVIFGTPFSGKTDINKNISVDLKAIIFINQSKTNKIEKMKTSDAIFNLTQQLPRPFFEETITLKNVDYISEILKRVDVYKLDCDISYQAVQVAYNALFN